MSDSPTAAAVAAPRDFPLPSLRQFLMPDQTVQLKTFQADTLQALEAAVNSWVQATKSIIAVTGPLSLVGSQVTLSLTYVAAVAGNYHV